MAERGGMPFDQLMDALALRPAGMRASTVPQSITCCSTVKPEPVNHNGE